MQPAEGSDVSDTNVLGLTVEPLSNGYIPLDAIVLAKCLTPDGEVAIEVRHTDGLAQWDRIGMLTIANDLARKSATDCWYPDASEGDDEPT